MITGQRTRTGMGDGSAVARHPPAVYPADRDQRHRFAHGALWSGGPTCRQKQRHHPSPGLGSGLVPLSSSPVVCVYSAESYLVWFKLWRHTYITLPIFRGETQERYQGLWKFLCWFGASDEQWGSNSQATISFSCPRLYTPWSHTLFTDSEGQRNCFHTSTVLTFLSSSSIAISSFLFVAFWEH